LIADNPISYVHPVSMETIALSTRWLNVESGSWSGSADDRPIMLLAHGAGADLDHLHMQKLAGSLAEVGIATLRFNFPFMELGKKRTDAIPVCVKAIDSALQYLVSISQNHPVILAGHSFGGRMMSHYVVDTGLPESHSGASKDKVAALIYFSFPLHTSGKPDTKRALHMPDIDLPQLFLSGTRDSLAERDLLSNTVSGLSNASIHWLETADHGFKILKRTRKNPEDVYRESARVIQKWLS